MKSIKLMAGAALTTLILCGCSKEEATSVTTRPYPLDVCIVTGETLGADPDMKPYTFVYKGQEIKLCCKSCLKDFDKDPQSYLIKLSTPPAE